MFRNMCVGSTGSWTWSEDELGLVEVVALASKLEPSYGRRPAQGFWPYVMELEPPGLGTAVAVSPDESAPRAVARPYLAPYLGGDVARAWRG